MADRPPHFYNPELPRHPLMVAVLCAALCTSTALSTDALADPTYSPYLMGPLGLNTIPSARMNPQGTIWAGVSTMDPYLHANIGVQIADPLYIGLRQSSEVSALDETPKGFSPGLDLKLRLLTEDRLIPALVVGANSAVGHKRTASEYIALSKRYKGFDFTLGAAWGRMGGAGHISNPLKSLGGHFKKPRAIDGNQQNGPSDWFTGDKIGFFGGVEYFTPWDGWSLKADWGADRYEFERNTFGYNVPAPWSASVVYNHDDFASISIGTQGADKIMGRLHFMSLASNSPTAADKEKSEIEKIWDRTDAPEYDPKLSNITQTDTAISADLHLSDKGTTPDQIQNAARYLMSHATAETVYFNITPYRGGIKTKTLSIKIKDFERATYDRDKSGEELWRKTLFQSAAASTDSAATPITPKNKRFDFSGFSYELISEASMAHTDSSGILRSSVLTGYRARPLLGFLTSGLRMRLNLQHDNPDGYYESRPEPRRFARHDFGEFADKRISLDHLYVSAQHSLTDSTHIAVTGGYLEEMFGGIGGEILYRPFKSRWALGAEGWWARQRDPFSDLNLDYDSRAGSFTGHINAWYDLPAWDVTLNGKFGRYLGEDIGVTIGASKAFNNGSKITAHTTISQDHDTDRLGGEVNTLAGLSYSVPLGYLSFTPGNSRITVKGEPLGANVGQILDAPIKLYDETRPLSYNHYAETWGDIVAD